MAYTGMDDRNAIEQQVAWQDRDIPVSLYGQICRTAEKFPNRPATSYQLMSGATDKAETVS